VAVKVYTIHNPDALFESGEVLFGFNSDALSGDDYQGERARALYAALGAWEEDEEYVLGELPDGRWALVGLTVAGHQFAVEDAVPAADVR